MIKALRKSLSFYLPVAFRRWYVYLPLNFVFGCLVVALVIIGIGSRIQTDALFVQDSLSEEVELQLKRMRTMVQRSAEQDRIDIYTDYTEICGEGIEWNYGFYVFYALSLEALVERFPERREYAAKQIDVCTRLMMQISVNVSDAEIQAHLAEPGDYAASLVSGYQCLVLGIRKKLVGDTLYDSKMTGIADALARELYIQLDKCGSVYTSDQSTQLHAIWRVDQTLGTDHSALFSLWMQTMQDKFIEPTTGMLQTIVSINPDKVISLPRTTSVAWSIIFLADIYPDFTAQQFAAMNADRVRRVVNLAAFAEYSELNLLDFGDMDSGPMLAGISPSATGFGLCAQRLYGTQADYTRTYRIFELFGLPKVDDSGKYYRMGNGMGDAILLYSKIVSPKENELNMLTADSRG